MRDSSPSPWLALLALLAAPGIGCDRPPGTPAPDLSPRLLHDTEEIAAYVEAFPVERYQVADVPGLGKFYVDDNPALVKRALLAGEAWEPYVIAEIEKHLAPGDTVLDIGAHIGSISVAMAQRVGPSGRVYAFEPQRKIYRELTWNVALNGLDQIVPLRFAVSSESSIVRMSPRPDYDGRSRVGDDGDPAEARTLDSFGFRDVALMKIDVEGHEVELLRGASRTIDASLPVIVIEIWQNHLAEVVSILQGYGYRLRKISHYDYVATHAGTSEGS